MHKPTPEAIAADIHATACAYAAGVITDDMRRARLAAAWATASLHALTDATTRALATIEANDRPFGPGALDVLLAAETHDVLDVCDAVDAMTGESHPAIKWRDGDDLVIPKPTLAALVRALCGVHRGA